MISGMQQRTAEWMAARLGMITSSEFRKVMTPPRAKVAKERGDLSGSACTYMEQLAWETISGVADTKAISRAMQHGINCEPTARRCYEVVTPCKVHEVGFCTHPTERLVGCSPDGLVGDDGIIEIKCPTVGANHLGYIRHGPVDHVAQIQGILWVTDRKWCDFISYHSFTPTLKHALHIVRIDRDQEYIDNLAAAVRNFRDRLEETLRQLTGRADA